MKFSAKAISFIFHPLIIPTIGFLLLFNSGFYFSLLSWEIKRFILIIVFFSTCILPVMTMAILALNPKFNYRMDKPTDRVLPLLFSALFYYIGFYLFRNLNIMPVVKLFLISSSLVIIVLLIISFRWKISIHLASIGGIIGLLLAVSFRTGTNPLLLVTGAFLVAGIVGTARIYLEKHNLIQVVAGFMLGFLGIFLPVFFL